MKCEFKPGDRVAFDIKSGRATVTGYGIVTVVYPNGRFIMQPDGNPAPGVVFENIRKVGDK